MFHYDIVTYSNNINLNTLKYPLYVYLELTDKCNFSCKFCSVNNKKNNYMSLETAKKIIKELSKQNIYDVYYTGGEPLLHPQFNEIVKYANKLKMRQTVLTNGYFINDKIESLKDMMYVCISLHGNEETHNKLTGINCYDRVMNNILLIKDITNININYTVTSENISDRDILNVCNFCKDNNLKLSFNKYNNIGVGKTNNCNIDINKFVKMLDKLKNKGYNFSINNCLPPCIVEEKYQYLCHGCGAGYLFASIDYNGNVKICPSASESFGNIRLLSFNKIWNNKKLKQYRDFNWIPIQCKSCINLQKCRCGCKIESGKNILNFNDQQVIEERKRVWDSIKYKKFKVNASLIRTDGQNYINLSIPTRKFNKKSFEIIKLLNDGLKPIQLEYAKDLILSLYRDKLLLECDNDEKKSN